MTEKMIANFHEVEVVKIVWPVVKLAADKWLDFSKLRDELAESNSKLEDCEEARSWCQDARSQCETRTRFLTYVIVFAFLAFLVGSIFFTITPRSRLLTT